MLILARTCRMRWPCRCSLTDLLARVSCRSSAGLGREQRVSESSYFPVGLNRVRWVFCCLWPGDFCGCNIRWPSPDSTCSGSGGCREQQFPPCVLRLGGVPCVVHFVLRGQLHWFKLDVVRHFWCVSCAVRLVLSRKLPYNWGAVVRHVWCISGAVRLARLSWPYPPIRMQCRWLREPAPGQHVRKMYVPAPLRSVLSAFRSCTSVPEERVPGTWCLLARARCVRCASRCSLLE